MKDDLITKLEHSVRTEQKWSDGIPQIAVGMFMIIAMLLALADKGSLFVVFIPIIPILIEGLRRRFTYPRVGMAVLRDKSPHRLIVLGLLAFTLVLGIVVMMITKDQIHPVDSTTGILVWLVPIVAIVVVLALLYRSWKEHNSRILWYVLFIVLLALGIIIFRPRRYVVQYIVLGFGVWHVLFGVSTLLLFVRKFPVMTDAE